MSGKTGGRLHKEDRGGGVADIGRELQLTPLELPPLGEDPEVTEEAWGNRPAATTVPGRHPVFAIFLGLIIAAVIGTVSTGIWIAATRETPPTSPTPATSTLHAAIETTVRGYLGSRTDLARSHWVVAGDATLPAMREFYSRPEVIPPRSFGSILEISDAAFDGFPMQMVIAGEGDGVTGHMFNVFPVGDRMLIDWESSVGFGELSLGKFLSKKPTTPVQMRLYLERDSYYNHGFTDDARWDSYKVSARGHRYPLHAYAESGTELGAKLRSIVLPGAKQPANIRLHWADKGRALVITELIHNDWVDIERLKNLSER